MIDVKNYSVNTDTDVLNEATGEEYLIMIIKILKNLGEKKLKFYYTFVNEMEKK